MNNKFKAQSLNRKSYRKFTLSWFSVTCFKHVGLLWPISALDRKQVRGYVVGTTWRQSDWCCRQPGTAWVLSVVTSGWRLLLLPAWASLSAVCCLECMKTEWLLLLPHWDRTTVYCCRDCVTTTGLLLPPARDRLSAVCCQEWVTTAWLVLLLSLGPPDWVLMSELCVACVFGLCHFLGENRRKL